MILHNKRGLKGKETTPVALVASFMNALFNIEKEYSRKEVFTLLENGRKRTYRLHHLTNADLQTATILLKVCNIRGVIEQTNPHSIYQVLQEYYEQPISMSQFYASMKKFKLHQLFRISHHRYSNLYTYHLNHFINEASEKIGFYVALSPVVFTKTFSKLSIANKKLFYSIYIQQGEKTDERSSSIERRLFTDKEDVQFSGLCNFLHRQDHFHIKKLLSELTQKKMDNGIPLFKKAQLVKRGKYYHKGIFFIHPVFFPLPEDKHSFHENIPLMISHKRKASFIKKCLEEWGLGELVVIEQKRPFQTMVKLFKNCNDKVIRAALYQLYLFQQENGRYPEDLYSFLHTEIRNKTLALIIDCAYRTNIYPFIAPQASGYIRREREYEFASKLSSYSLRVIESAFTLALPELMNLYTVPPEFELGLSDYTHEEMLNELKGIDTVRFYALKLKKNVMDYKALEKKAVKKVQVEKSEMNFDRYRFMEWMLEQVDKIKRIEFVVHVDQDYKVEEYLLEKIFPFITK